MEKNRIFVEKYRPDSFDDIILEQKNLIENIIKSPKEYRILYFIVTSQELERLLVLS